MKWVPPYGNRFAGSAACTNGGNIFRWIAVLVRKDNRHLAGCLADHPSGIRPTMGRGMPEEAKGPGSN